jgi:hypothetical protein
MPLRSLAHGRPVEVSGPGGGHLQVHRMLLPAREVETRLRMVLRLHWLAIPRGGFLLSGHMDTCE